MESGGCPSGHAGSNPVRGVYGEVCKSGHKQTVPKTGEPEKVRGLPRGLGASAVANPTFVVLPPWSNWYLSTLLRCPSEMASRFPKGLDASVVASPGGGAADKRCFVIMQ